jgi:hypothetical protein
MTILVTISVNLADPVTLHELRKFLDTAEQNGADPDMDLREYDEQNDLVGLAAVGELSSDEAEDEAEDEECEESDEGEENEETEETEEGAQSADEPGS